MDDTELDAVEALFEHITPGPWAYLACGEKDNSWQVGVWERPDATPIAGEVNDDDAERYEAEGFPDQWEGHAVCIETVCENTDAMANLSDAAFIAEAPALVASLLKTARGERERASQLAAVLENMNKERMYLYDRLSALDPAYAASKAAASSLSDETLAILKFGKRKTYIVDDSAVVSSTQPAAQRFEPMPDDDGDFSLVTFDAAGKPSCVKHGAMNKLSPSPPEGTGTWRCITTNGGYRGQGGGCRAGCRESVSSRAAKEET